MPFEFPQFSRKIPIDATRWWTATFDSHDQRTQYARVHDGGDPNDPNA
jgi:hypothetical protein